MLYHLLPLVILNGDDVGCARLIEVGVVHFVVSHPLYEWMTVAEDATHKRHVAPNHHRLVSRFTIKHGLMRKPFYKREVSSISMVKCKTEVAPVRYMNK